MRGYISSALRGVLERCNGVSLDFRYISSYIDIAEFDTAENPRSRTLAVIEGPRLDLEQWRYHATAYALYM